MIRIFIIAEGETEERFVRQVMYPHFINLGIHLEPEQWITNRKSGNAGGGRSFDLIENHINNRLNRYASDKNVFITTMIDLYKFPLQGRTVYDQEVKNTNTGAEKKTLLEAKMSERFNFYRFIPYVQLHEFEALLFADILKLKMFYTDKQIEINKLAEGTNHLNPEEINEKIETSPSHRILSYLPTFEKQKATAGPTVASLIGLETIRQKCPGFNDWVRKLEGVVNL